MGESDRKVRTWVSRVKPPPLDPSGIGNVMQRHISKENWTNGIEKGTTLFIGVPTFATLKVDKQHVFHNRDLLKGLLQFNSNGIFNKSTIASALDTLDNTGAMRAKHGSNWGMQHGWFIIQCMAYIKKRSKEYTPKTEPWLVDLIKTMKTFYDRVKTSSIMDQDSQDTQDTLDYKGAQSSTTPLPKAPIRRRSLFMRVSETSAPEEKEQHSAPQPLALCDKPTREHLDKVFLYSMVGNFATMIHKGEHIVSRTYTTNKDNHRIYLWPCGTTWTCTEGFVDGEAEGEEEEAEGGGPEEIHGGEEEAYDGEQEEEEEEEVEPPKKKKKHQTQSSRSPAPS